jgi:DNA-binding ferritin-like protein (Dps family)
MFHYIEKRTVEMPASVLVSHRLLTEDLRWREDDGPYLYRKHPVTPMSVEEVKELRDCLDKLIKLMEGAEDPVQKSVSDEVNEDVEQIIQSLKEDVERAKRVSQQQSPSQRNHMSGRFRAT